MNNQKKNQFFKKFLGHFCEIHQPWDTIFKLGPRSTKCPEELLLKKIDVNAFLPLNLKILTANILEMRLEWYGFIFIFMCIRL